MPTVVDWPAEVHAAASIKFVAPIGAFLWRSKVDHPCLICRVYMDLSGRFQDGGLIWASQTIGGPEQQAGRLRLLSRAVITY